MRIDSHQHVFWHGRDDAGLVADLEANHIDFAWLLSWDVLPADDDPAHHAVLNPVNIRADGTHCGVPLGDLLLCRSRYPDRFLIGYCPHPLRRSAPDLLEAAHDIHGARVCGEWKFRVLFDDPRCVELFRRAGRLGMPVVLHLDIPWMPDGSGSPVYQPLWYGGTVENLERSLRSCPDTVFIGHAPGFWREISGEAAAAPSLYPPGPIGRPGRLQRLLDTYPNLSADLSAQSGLNALRRDPAHAKDFLVRYQDRLLFGRDIYGSELGDFLDGLGLAPGVAEKVYWRNAQALAGTPSA